MVWSVGRSENTVIWIYRFVILGAVVFGAVREANVIWQLGDIGVGLLAWVNVIALLFLCPKATGALRSYESILKKTGKEPVWEKDSVKE